MEKQKQIANQKKWTRFKMKRREKCIFINVKYIYNLKKTEPSLVKGDVTWKIFFRRGKNKTKTKQSNNWKKNMKGHVTWRKENH